ncbi:MAG: DNA-binding protein [Candidatus Bathyarchaeota archaeon]|nr:DNA-binding protein [Candidatus Bathyarchaeota archaeon]
MGSDPELEDIRRKKLQELRGNLAAEEQRAERQKTLEMQKKALLRQVLTTEARQRLNRIKLVKPQFAEGIELQLIQLAQSGRVRLPISDTQLKTILKNLQSPKREIKFRRI